MLLCTLWDLKLNNNLRSKNNQCFLDSIKFYHLFNLKLWDAQSIHVWSQYDGENIEQRTINHSSNNSLYNESIGPQKRSEHTSYYIFQNA